LLLSQLSFATDWSKLDAQLAERIASATGPGVIALDIANRSSISAADVNQIRQALITLLAASGVRVWQPDQAAAVVKVTLSENLQSYVWIATIHQGSGEQRMLLISAPRPETALPSQSAPALLLRATPLLARAEPILDAALMESNPRTLLVLGTKDVSIFNFKDGHWLPSIRLGLNPVRPLPRDARGRILPAKDHLFDAYLPGLICRSTNSNPPGIECAPSDDPWPLQTPQFGVSGFFAPARNFFTGDIVPGIGKQKSAAAFYSAAAVARANYTLWVLTGVDGEVRLMDGINQQTLSKIHWGSSVAGIRAACRAGWQILASSPEADSEDSLQAFEFPDREPVAVSQKLTVPGDVTALWTARDGDTATAIYRNSGTGDYEAVQLTLTCSQ
jgi:hypothetical protein